MNRIVALLFLVLAFAAVGCRDWFPPVDPKPDPDPEPGAQEFRNIRWQLVAFESNGAVDMVPANVDASIQFDMQGQASGSNGCNGYGGEYKAGNDGSLSFGPLVQTEMACAEPRSTVERRFMEGLQTAKSYKVDGDVLRIFATGVTLRFSKSASPSGGGNAFEVRLDEPFNLMVDQTATVAGEDLSINFAQVVEDSRCPANANCVWAGNGKIALTVASGGTAQKVELNTFVEPKKVSVMNYTIELLELAPYPYDSTPIPSSDYVALLRVTKQ